MTDQDALDLEIPDQPAPALPAGACGPVEAAVRQSLQAASLPAIDAGAAALACAQARSVDAALAGKPNPYAVAAAGRELSLQLARLGLDPASRKDAGSSGLDEEWAQLQANVQNAIRNSGGAGQP